MNGLYIYGSCALSIQPTFQDGFDFSKIEERFGQGIKIVEPDYKELIPALQLRRMGKSMRMAVYASQKALRQAGNPTIEAVITGTGEGCLRDSEKFVEAMWENEGGVLNPTPFIQSTHNMAAATIALALGCKGYNMTYTNNSNSFESALIDAMLFAQENPESNLLVGGLDEIGEQTLKFWEVFGYLKKGDVKIPFSTYEISDGEIATEGAGFFVVSGTQSPNSLGKIVAVKTALEVDNPKEFVLNFLTQNNLKINELHAVIMGFNGDSKYDEIYKNLTESLFMDLPQISYKNVLGEFDTVSSLALEVGLKVFSLQKIPNHLKINELKKDRYQNILIYNQRRGKNHSLIWMQK